MRRRRKTDPITETVIVHTEDGKTFRCSIVSSAQGTDPHWVLMDEDAAQFIGPPVVPSHGVEDVQQQIRDWWRERNAPNGNA
jgi:hypothetical protein